jgi:hypothetical protein
MSHPHPNPLPHRERELAPSPLWGEGWGEGKFLRSRATKQSPARDRGDCFAPCGRSQ